jgi:hypothetical protein
VAVAAKKKADEAGKKPKAEAGKSSTKRTQPGKKTSKAKVKTADGLKAGRKSGKGAAQHKAKKRRTIPVPVVVGREASGQAELNPFEVAKQTMKGSVPAIVEAMVELAKQGSCTHAKTLLEMTGAKHMFEGDAQTEASGEPWAKLVLERLDEADRESASEQEQEEVAAER